MGDQTTVPVATRVSPMLNEAIETAAEKLGYKNKSDFMSHALREKVERDAPQLLKKIVE